MTTKIPPELVGYQIGRRNLIINGDMRVAQRGTSFTSSGYSLDRWYHQLSGGTSTTTQETFALGSEVAGLSKYLKQATSTGNNYCGLVYKVEDVKSIHEGKATFSFYAKGTNPAGGNFTVRLGRVNTGTTFFDTPLNSTLTLTSTWQRFVYTFDVPSFSGMGTIGSDSHLYISIHQADGDTGTAAWELNLTGVQLELGSQATPFEFRSIGEVFDLCQRYFRTSRANGAYDYIMSTVQFETTTAGQLAYNHTGMRASPTVSSAGTMQFEAAGAGATLASTSLAGDQYLRVTFTSVAAVAVRDTSNIRDAGNGDAVLNFDSEL
jgi:hypothetical protein